MLLLSNVYFWWHDVMAPILRCKKPAVQYGKPIGYPAKKCMLNIKYIIQLNKENEKYLEHTASKESSISCMVHRMSTILCSVFTFFVHCSFLLPSSLARSQYIHRLVELNNSIKVEERKKKKKSPFRMIHGARPAQTPTHRSA